VIKVERPGEGDDTRAFAPSLSRCRSGYFLSVNRNKKSITLDMKMRTRREVLWRLIDTSDSWLKILGRRDGPSWLWLRRRQRSPPGHGVLLDFRIRQYRFAEGPSGYDVIVQGEAGIQDITGPADGAPYKVGTSIADLISGLTDRRAFSRRSTPPK